VSRENLREAVTEVIDRLNDIAGRMHNAIEGKDTDAQRTALEAIVTNIVAMQHALDEDENGEGYPGDEDDVN